MLRSRVLHDRYRVFDSTEYISLQSLQDEGRTTGPGILGWDMQMQKECTP